MPIPRKLVAAVTALAAVAALSGCGNKEETLSFGETEGIFVNVGPMLYQVQIARQLNPLAVKRDSTFVQGVPAAERDLADDETWFAVFIRVENPTKEPQLTADQFVIEDTAGNHFEPIRLGPANPYRYTETTVPGREIYPSQDSVAGQTGSINGVELLFKLPYATLDNRPLELLIKSSRYEREAHVELDV